jgi:hypothetical protein
MDERRWNAHPAPVTQIELDTGFPINRPPRKGLAAEIRGLLRTPRTLDDLRRLLPLEAEDVERSLNGLHGARLVRRLDPLTWTLGDPKMHPAVKVPRVVDHAAYAPPPGVRFELDAWERRPSDRDG